MSLVLQRALEQVYPGDQSLEAMALEDKLADLNHAIVPLGFTYELPGIDAPRRRRWWPWGRR